MIARIARSITVGCFALTLLLARTGESSTMPLFDAEALPDGSLEHGASPLDAWIDPYRSIVQSAVSERYLASSALTFGVSRIPTVLDWWSRELTAGKRFRVADPRRFVLLRRFTHPGRERFRPAPLLWASRLDPERFPLVPALNWRSSESEFVETAWPWELSAVRPLSAPAMKQRKCSSAARPQPIVITSWGSDWDRLLLVDCDGDIEVDALDRVSALSRIMGEKRPELPLPDAPTPPADWPEEWIPGVRLLHPRLLWILQRIGVAFPKHTIHIMSGYRRDARETSPHRMGRALDLSVRGVSQEQLFAFCMTLNDVACGYYPYHPFVHVDVRPFGTPKLYWVDASRPGERSEYVDSWPFVVESGALAGAGSE